MKRFSYDRIRARLLLLVLFAMLPVASFTVYNFREQQILERNSAHLEAQRLIRPAASNHSQLLYSASSLLPALSHQTRLAELSEKSCTEIFTRLLNEFPAYTGFTIARASGDVLCTVEGIYGVDLEGKATFLNPAAARMVGYKPQELLGKPIHAILHHTRADGSPYPARECPRFET
jgi:PAS domain-containing protein